MQAYERFNTAEKKRFKELYIAEFRELL
jgi:hypothetical protein